MATPEGYKLPYPVWDEASRRAAQSESSMEWTASPSEAVQGADVVYTDTWVSMGDEAEADERKAAFAGYQVNAALMDEAREGAVFMHDMPAYRGNEISEGMIDDARSVVFDQAENRLHGQNAVMVELFGG